MLDYISTEIVAYADDIYGAGYFSGVAGTWYLDTLSTTFCTVSEATLSRPWYYPLKLRDVEVQALVASGFLTQTVADEHSGNWYWVHCIRDMDLRSPSNAGYQLYYLDGLIGNWLFPEYHLVNVYCSTLPDIYNPQIGGTDIYWLYNLGNYILLNVADLNAFLNRSVLGGSLSYFMFGAGFIVFATWAIIKWVNPL